MLSHLLVSGGFLLWAITGPLAPLPTLLAVAVLFGIGYGAWLALGAALLAATRHPAHLGRALGSLAAAVGTGGVLGPMLAAPLFENAATTLLAACSLIALGAAAVLFLAPLHRRGT
jgi:hypothetical protein